MSKRTLSKKAIRRGMRDEKNKRICFNHLMNRLEYLIYRAVEFNWTDKRYLEKRRIIPFPKTPLFKNA